MPDLPRAEAPLGDAAWDEGLLTLARYADLERLAAMPRRRRGRADHIPHLAHLVDRAGASTVRCCCAERSGREQS